MKIFARVLGEYRDFLGKKLYYILFGFGFFASILNVAEPLFFSRILEVVEKFIRTQNFDNEALISHIILWVLFILFNIIVQYIYRYYLVDKNVLKFYAHKAYQYSNAGLNTSYGAYLGKKQGETFKRLDRGKGDILHFLFFFFLELVKNFTGVFVILIVLFFIHVKMTLITISLLPVAVFIGLFFNKKTIEQQKQNNAAEDTIFGVIGDGLTNFGLLKILGLEKKISRDFKQSMQKILERQYLIAKRWSVAGIYIGILIAVMRLIVLVSGVYMLKNGELSLAELFLFFSYIGWIYFPLGAIFGQMRNLQEQATGIEKSYQEFEDEFEFEEKDAGEQLKNISGNIHFKDLSFGYSHTKNILNTINLKITSGQKVALVGNTGAGKSTIVNLLLRFWDSSSGSIFIDGNNILDIQKSSIRNNIGIVSQDNSLFNVSIRDNLLFASPESSDEDLKRALQQAEAMFVFDLENGIDTVIGERGLKLSGGEKQRISIARLFLKDPKILVLDEATSALDNRTEKQIQKSLNILMKGRTSLIVAHRLSTIQDADIIVMLENGTIVEQGNYNDLMAKKGKFFSLAKPDHMTIV